MADRKRRRRVDPPPAATDRRGALEGDEAERTLGRVVAAGLPVVCVGTAALVGFMAGVGSALLVLAAGALVGTIALLWASLRTLTGDAPLPADLEALAARDRRVNALDERKRRVLLALKDLEGEHALGKIDDTDYESFVSRYREEAKSVMREMDHAVSPARAEAERLVRDYLAHKGLGPKLEPEAAADATGRRGCTHCGTSNEADAAFCKQCGSAILRAPAGNDATA